MLRISPQQANGASAGASLVVSVIDTPPPEDQVVEGEEEVAVAVDPTAAVLLDDKQLDATVVGDQISFSIAEQA
jgi:Fe-S cluster assembly iron-binding protein IscA